MEKKERKAPTTAVGAQWGGAYIKVTGGVYVMVTEGEIVRSEKRKTASDNMCLREFTTPGGRQA